MTIKVLQPGLQTTIQDLGRFGSQKFGVIVGGAMDAVSLRIANLLVGNEEAEGALEITLFGTKLAFQKDQLISITGGNLQPTIDGQTAPMWRPVSVRKGSTLQFKAASTGCRAYLAFAGGLDVPTIINSKSTYLKAGIGGFEGRSLQKGDLLTCGTPTAIGKSLIEQLQTKESLPWFVNHNFLSSINKEQAVRILQGSEFERFDEASRNAFLNESYTISTESDRMGYRLEGKSLFLAEEFELLSEAVTFGTIQVPANGQPIILMADRQTTGGYPKIGQVISADLPRLAQLQPMAQIQVEFVSMKEAESALIRQEQILHELAIGIRLKAR